MKIIVWYEYQKSGHSDQLNISVWFIGWSLVLGTRLREFDSLHTDQIKSIDKLHNSCYTIETVIRYKNILDGHHWRNSRCSVRSPGRGERFIVPAVNWLLSVFLYDNEIKSIDNLHNSCYTTQTSNSAGHVKSQRQQVDTGLLKRS